MLKRKDGNEINPDTFIYSVQTFKLVKHNADMDEEYIYIRVAIENGRVFFIRIDSNGQYCVYNMSTNMTFRMQWDETFTAYECDIDNIDIEYH